MDESLERTGRRNLLAHDACAVARRRKHVLSVTDRRKRSASYQSDDVHAACPFHEHGAAFRLQHAGESYAGKQPQDRDGGAVESRNGRH